MWARTGNVNLAASTTVNGGTSSPMFQTNGVRPGYIFQGPDGREYEIQQVNSETQLILVTAYQGTPASNQSYAIIPLSAAAYAAALSEVLALINTLSTAIQATTLKVGAPTETAAVAAFLGTLLSFESNASSRFYVSKGAIGNDGVIELAVAKSGRARLGLVGNNNIVLQTSANGSAWVTVFTHDITTAPASPRLLMNAPLAPVTLTIATLPAAHVAGSMVYCSDLGGGGGWLRSDGTGWLRQHPGYATDSSIVAHTHTELVDAGDIRLTGTLAADRLLTLSTTNARLGAQRHYTRTGGGAFNWSIGSLKNLAQNQWCAVKYDGSSWYLKAFGSL